MSWKLFYDLATWLGGNWAKVRPWITPVALAKGNKPVPTDTFRIVLDTSDHPFWHMGKVRSGPATQVFARYYVTNIVDEKMLVVGCKLRSTGTDRVYDLDHFTRQIPDSEGTTPTTIVTVNGFIHPPIATDGETFEAQIIVLDQFGNENAGPVTSFKQK